MTEQLTTEEITQLRVLLATKTVQRLLHVPSGDDFTFASLKLVDEPEASSMSERSGESGSRQSKDKAYDAVKPTRQPSNATEATKFLNARKYPSEGRPTSQLKEKTVALYKRMKAVGDHTDIYDSAKHGSL